MIKSNYIYLYNNDFVSLLNLIVYLFEKRLIPINIKNIYYQANLFEMSIKLDILSNENIVKKIIDKLGVRIFNTLYYIYISNYENKELVLYYFFINSIKYKNKVFYLRNKKSVEKTLELSKKVSHELHKYKGFLRFEELSNNIFLAYIEPENDILFLLSKHFKDRLKNEYWIIKDVKRGIYSVYNKNDFFIVSENDFNLLDKKNSEAEKNIQKLWKSFYKTIGIKERKNDRCRMNFMPKKYWKYITEMSEYNEKSS